MRVYKPKVLSRHGSYDDACAELLRLFNELYGSSFTSWNLVEASSMAHRLNVNSLGYRGFYYGAKYFSIL